MKRLLLPFLITLPLAVSAQTLIPKETGVLVYGATPAGISAAIAAARLGEKVTLIEPSYLIGGMVSGGLTKTDIGQKGTVGGISMEFYNNIRDFYKNTYGPDSEQVKATSGGIFFEANVAEDIYKDMLKKAGVEVVTHQRILSAELDNITLRSITLEHSQTGERSTVSAKSFVDASYEGDLMAAAEVPYRVGREARVEYNESLAGMVDGPAQYIGKGDHRLQAYNFRSTLTNDPNNLVPIEKPEYYKREWHYNLVQAVLRSKATSLETFFDDVNKWGNVNRKHDPNRADFIGANYAYAEGDYVMRKIISDRTRDYWLAYWWTLQNDPDLPEVFKENARKWGLPKDMYVESGHVSPQMYIREARRMLGRYMMNQNDLVRYRFKPDTICLASYNIDSHMVQTIISDEKVHKEGHIIAKVDPYEVPYRSITPYAPTNLLVTCALSATHIAYGSIRMEPVFMMIGQAAGTAAHLSLKHGSSVQDVDIKELQALLKKDGIPLAAPFRPIVRIQAEKMKYEVNEPVRLHALIEDQRADIKEFYWNFDGSGSVQSTSQSPVIKFPASRPITVSLMVKDADGEFSDLETLTLQIGDNTESPDVSVLVKDAKLEGRWQRGSNTPERRFRDHLHDINRDKGKKSATFTATLPRSGRYRVAFAWQGGGNRATNVPITIQHADGVAKISLDQKNQKSPFTLAPLGDFRFTADKPAVVTVSNEGTKSFVSIDEVLFIYLGP